MSKDNFFRITLDHSQSPPRVIEGKVTYYPCGKGMKLKISGNGPSRYVQSPEILEIINLETGEVLENVTDYFRKKYVTELATLNDGKIPLASFLNIIPIMGLGDLKARIIDRHFKSWDNFANEIRLCLSGHYQEYESELCSLFMIGPSQYQKIIDFFSQPDAWKIIDDLTYGYKIGSIDNSQINSHLLNKSIVFTGSFVAMSRPEAKAIAENSGARVCGSISKFIDYVVVGENAGSKLKEAQLLNLPILTEKEFLILIGKSV